MADDPARPLAGRIVRIGGFSAFWGDSDAYAGQLVRDGRCDYLIGDYLAEITMSLLARAKAKDPRAGFATDAVATLAPLAGDALARGTKIVTNAGGLNPEGAREAFVAAARASGAAPRIAVVAGDDLLPRLAELRERDVREMSTGAALPAAVVSANAYLGALPIARALAAGADIVLCGRVADSALALGILMHEFGWQPGDYDRLAAGSLAGHVLECGAQATGGIFTDWRDVPGWDDMALPVAECAADGTFAITKAGGGGGLVSPATVAEQIVYELGDPAAYVLPDVVCDFTGVRCTQAGRDRVVVAGARGRAPTATYKVSATYADGYRVAAAVLVAGGEAAPRAERAGHAVLARAQRLAAARGFAPFAETSVEVVGGGDIVGEPDRARDAAEVVLKIAARHAEREPLERLAREIAPAACAMAQGLTGFASGRPSVSPVVRLFSFLLDKAAVPAYVDIGGERIALPETVALGADASAPNGTVAARAQAETHAGNGPDPAAGPDARSVPLRALAWGRSGDKGDACNVGVIARHAAFVATIASQLTAERVAARFAYAAKGPVTRYAMPGLHAFNFVIERALGGGGVASLRFDPQGKAFAQILLDAPMRVPAGWCDADGRIDIARVEAAACPS